jgi:PKD domain
MFPRRTRRLSDRDTFRKAAAGWSLLGSLLLLPSPSRAQAPGGPRILHDGLRCIAAGRHPIVDALVEPADGLVTVKAYFRAEFSPLFYFVEMSREGDRFRGVLPKPSSTVQSMVYYLEAVDSTFNSLRTEEFHPRIVAAPSDCENDGPPAAYLEGPGNITVGATGPGPSFPMGFLTDGIVGTISAAGRAAAASGGIGSGTLLAIGAAAGGAVGVGIVAGKGGEATSTAPSGVATTSVNATTTSAVTSTIPPVSGAVTACFDTEPNPPVVFVGGTVRFDASCTKPSRDEIASYLWDFNDGRDSKDGRVVNRVYNDPGVFPAELIVTDLHGNQGRISKDVRVDALTTPGPGGPGPGPGPTSTVPGSADLQISGFSGPATLGSHPSNGNYSVSFRNNGPDLDPTVTVVTVFAASGAGGAPTAVSIPGGCGTSGGGGSLSVSCFIGALGSGGTGSLALTVRFPSADTYRVNTSIFGGTSDPSPGNNGGFVQTAVNLKAGTSPLEAAFVTEIQSAARGQIQATLELNGTETSLADDTGPRRQVMKARPGRNVAIGFATGPSLDGALWRIDFSSTERFVPGSLVVEGGEVAGLDAYRVMFRLSSGAPRVRFRFQLEP